MLISRFRHARFWQLFLIISCVSVMVAVAQRTASALAPLPPDPQSGSVGLEGTLGAKPPTQAATITIPTNGQVFTNNPITVSGLCPKGLLVKIFSNNVFVGSVECTNGSFSIQVDLFSDRNDLIARVYDALDQAGPDSNTITVTLNNAQFAEFGSQMSLTSSYAKRGADPGQQLDWPIILSGGTGPYAISVDWGDGKPAELLSESFSGTIDINHTYSTAGVFTIVIRATDKNGQAAFLQLVGIANGPVTQNNSTQNQNTTTTRTVVLWWPAVAMLPLIAIAFWLGRRSELYGLRRQLERSNEK